MERIKFHFRGCSKKKNECKCMKRKVWIIHPLCHGNGGWYGQSILSSKKGMQLKRALSILNPFTEYDIYNDYRDSGYLGAIRICIKPDANKSILYFDGEDYLWTKR